MTLLRAEGIVREFEGGRVRAVRGVSLEVDRGQFATIMGPSGSGKSTLLHILGGMDRPTAGEVWFDGRPLSRERDLDGFRARSVGFVFQMHNLVPVLTAAQNVEMPMMPLGVPRSERRARARELLGMLGLGARADAVVVRLSGGERQRVAVARALANRPPLILADEPTGNLDSATGREVIAALHEARRLHGAALVLVTHNPEICAGADRRWWMRDGLLYLSDGSACDVPEPSSARRAGSSPEA
jgi:putative ABC transport system ATP-binding protein